MTKTIKIITSPIISLAFLLGMTNAGVAETTISAEGQYIFNTLAFYIGNAIAVPGRSVITISVPLLSKACENQNLKEIKTIYSKSSINQLIVSGFLFLIIWLNLHDVFTLLPEKFTHGKWVVFYIGLAQLINMACGVNGAIIVNSDYYKFDLYTNLFLLIVTICSNLLLIPKLGDIKI